MANNITLTLACGDYEITRPLIDGTVKPDGIDLVVLSNMDSTTRHWRYLRNREFDMAETSASSYIVAKDRGMPIDALPVFPHRRFRHGFIYVNTSSGITNPADLVGRRVGIKSYLVTAGHWLRGILQDEYGVHHQSIRWVTELDEDIDFTPPPGLDISRLPNDASVEAMLAKGDLDAVIHSSLIKPFLAGDPRVARLFADYRREEEKYFAKTAIFPIMHVLAINREIVDKYPWVTINMYHAFNQAKAIAMKRMENPRVMPLAWQRHAWEEQQRLLGPDPWEYGLGARNRHNIDTLARYSFEQGLTSRLLSAQDLFLAVDQGRKRGEEFRI